MSRRSPDKEKRGNGNKPRVVSDAFCSNDLLHRSPNDSPSAGDQFVTVKSTFAIVILVVTPLQSSPPFFFFRSSFRSFFLYYDRNRRLKTRVASLIAETRAHARFCMVVFLSSAFLFFSATLISLLIDSRTYRT